ncbi:hypothetical protein FB451DRAFT_1416914 [Mycena latifolia]|nr:hypothetical protein FB451DRAFT_1416914 [Mycena latifolia]
MSPSRCVHSDGLPGEDDAPPAPSPPPRPHLRTQRLRRIHVIQFQLEARAPVSQQVVAAQRKTNPASLIACLTACPTEVSSTEALVEEFCAAAAKPTSLSFPSFVPSSTSASASTSASSVSGFASSTAASTTAPASSSPPPSTTPSNAARPLGVGMGMGHGMGGVVMTVAGILRGAAAVALVLSDSDAVKG